MKVTSEETRHNGENSSAPAIQTSPLIENVGVPGAYIHGLSGNLILQVLGFNAAVLDFAESLPAVMRLFDKKENETHNRPGSGSGT
jgi:hypothetical protein